VLDAELEGVVGVVGERAEELVHIAPGRVPLFIADSEAQRDQFVEQQFMIGDRGLLWVYAEIPFRDEQPARRWALRGIELVIPAEP
jgi:hypothetical protein